MPTRRQPRCGSLQFVPRKRAKKTHPRIRAWTKSDKAVPLGFAGYKVGMGHYMFNETRKTARFTKEVVREPFTIIECPPIVVLGIRAYKNNRGVCDVLSPKLKKSAQRRLPTPKKIKHSLDSLPEHDRVALLVHTQPDKTSIGKKIPEVFEIPLGGSKEDQLSYAKENLGKEILVTDVIEKGKFVDAHSITKGKGFQGVVRRDGVALRSHKSEKSVRAAVLGAEGFAKVNFTAHQPGQLGYHNRTQYNNPVISIEEKLKQPKGGFHKYGVTKNPCILVKGSIMGAKKRLVILTQALRAPKRQPHNQDITALYIP